MSNLLSDSVLDIPGPWEDLPTPEIAPAPARAGGYPQGSQLIPFAAGMSSGSSPVAPIMADAMPDLPVEQAETASYEGGGIFPVSISGPPERGQAEPEDLIFPSASSPAVPFMQHEVIPPLPPAAVLAPSYQPAGGPLQQAVGEIPQQHAHMLGLSIIGAATGAVMGYRYGGGYGAISGTVLAGSVLNAYRAFKHMQEGTPDGRREAMVSGTYSIGAAVLGSLIWWKLASKGQSYSGRRYSSNRCRANEGGCGIRPAGP
jgi:hypothetical protein